MGCLSAMGAILLTVLTVFLGFGLGKGVPRLAYGILLLPAIGYAAGL